MTGGGRAAAWGFVVAGRRRLRLLVHPVDGVEQVGQLQHPDGRQAARAEEDVVVVEPLRVLEQGHAEVELQTVDLEASRRQEAVVDPLLAGVGQAEPVQLPQLGVLGDDAPHLGELGGVELLARPVDVDEVLREGESQAGLDLDQGLAVLPLLHSVELIEPVGRRVRQPVPGDDQGGVDLNDAPASELELELPLLVHLVPVLDDNREGALVRSVHDVLRES